MGKLIIWTMAISASALGANAPKRKPSAMNARVPKMTMPMTAGHDPYHLNAEERQGDTQQYARLHKGDHQPHEYIAGENHPTRNRGGLEPPQQSLLPLLHQGGGAKQS